jgi:hypothetical protein
MTIQSVRKRLSSNDTGETGSHQAGILVPRREEVLTFFPRLDVKEKNPRATLVMREVGSDERWEFQFIYYNGKFFEGTRNEYRLTHMTKYLAAVNAVAGDELVFSQDSDGGYRVRLMRHSKGVVAQADELVLAGGWKVISISGGA